MVDFDPATTIYPQDAGNESRWGVTFIRQTDRLGHLLFVESDQGQQTLVRSLEGIDTQDWPPSPVLQQMDRCDLNDHRKALVGVGSCGTSHWSLAVECDAAGGFWFDVACRAKTPPAFLGSSYELATPQSHQECDPQGAIYHLGSGRQLTIHCSQPDSWVSQETEPQRLVIRPTTSPTSWPVTVRWKYRLQLTFIR
jgi:hypothetical protein